MCSDHCVRYSTRVVKLYVYSVVFKSGPHNETHIGAHIKHYIVDLKINGFSSDNLKMHNVLFSIGLLGPKRV